MLKRESNDDKYIHKMDETTKIETSKLTPELTEDSCSTKKEKLKFNIGGTIFETFKTTLQSSERTRLCDEGFLQRHFDADSGEYFFDRDPELFRSVLNYERYGTLHLPAHICGAVVQGELEFWGIEDGAIEACCWTGYNGWTSTVQALKQLENDRKQHVQHDLHEDSPWHERTRRKIWLFLTSHNSSIPAQIYGWVSLCFVLVSICSFCAATHPYFKPPPNINSTTSTNSSTSVNTSTFTNTSTSTKNPTSDTNLLSKAAQTHSFQRDTERHEILFYADVICLAFFTLEYVLRIICAPRKIKFILSPLSIIDLLAILPDYIEFIVYLADPRALDQGTFINFMPLLRLMRAFRIFRLIRHVPGLWIMFYTLKASFKDLFLMLVFLLVGMLLSSALIYYADDKEVFTSIPHGFWWSVVTMTTVGYGDMYPTTALGRLVGSFTAVCGVLLIGFTIPALVNNFSLYYQHVEYAIQKERTYKQKQKKDKSTKKLKIDDYHIYKDPKVLHEQLPLYEHGKTNGVGENMYRL